MKILEFGTAHCGICKNLAKIISSIDGVNKGDNAIPFESIDIEEHDEYIKKYNLKRVPTTIIFDNAGKEIMTLVGFYTKVQFEDIIKKLK